jgi:hypothetical protein
MGRSARIAVSTASNLTAADVELHARLGIPPELIERVARRVTDREAREVLSSRHTGNLAGIIYNYNNPITGHRETCRLRRDHCELEDGKPRDKYLSAFGDRRHLFFPPDVAELLVDITVPVIMVEAEKSSLATTAAAKTVGRRVLVPSTGGVYGWRGRIGKAEDARGARVDEVGPLHDFDRIAWPNRDVIIAFDANAATNPKVQGARRALARELYRRGAAVRIANLPEAPGVNGPDDYIGICGADMFFALIDAAPDARTFDAILRLNLRHAVVRESGRTVVITEEHDPVLNRGIVTRSTFGDFRNFYLRESIQVGTTKSGEPIYRPLGAAWLTHPDRRQYEGLVMSPRLDVPGYLNLWRGFAVEPAPGSWARLQEHLYENISGANATIYDYIVNWLAHGVQRADRPEVAIAMRGPRGTGKGILARTYGELFGQHYLQIANAKHLTGNFNAHLQDAIVLFADEAFWAGDKAGESVLKMLVTEPVIPIERKGRDVVLVKNLLHIIMASNNDWIVPAGMDERRFLVVDVEPHRQQDHAYFAAIVAELENGGRAAMLHDLLNRDLAGVQLRDVPATEALRQQKVLSLSADERWLFDKLMAGCWLPEHDQWERFVRKDQLHDDYIRQLQKVGIDRRRTETELGMFLTRMFPHATTKRLRLDQTLRRGWICADLATCRQAFDAATRSTHPWPEGEGDE